MADVPDGLVLKRHRDLEGRGPHVYLRRALLTLLVVLPLAAALNAFGQRPTTEKTTSAAASLSVYAPARIRSGDIFTARFHVHARRDLKDATLVLDPGWIEQMTFNGVAPEPLNFASRDGRIALSYGHVGRGHSLIVFISFQVNPTNVGRRSQDVELADGESRLLTIDRTFTVFP